MDSLQARGLKIREVAKEIVLDYLKSESKGQPEGEGIKQAVIFRQCGFDWGAYPKAPSSQQQYWIVALLRELEAERKVKQIKESGPWALS